MPDFWRTEVFHPMVVHFPVALLLVASFFQILSLIKPKWSWTEAYRILLLLGIAGSWLAIYTGNLADGEVSRNLCDPTVLKDHENYSYAVAWIFTAGLVLSFFEKRLATLRILLSLILVVGSFFLVYTGHLGASLVYQQAAGVHIPAEDCADFE